MKNKLIKKIGLGLALTGVLSAAAVSTAFMPVKAQAEECTFDIENLTGDYTVIENSAYKNYGTVGKPIKFTTDVTGHAVYLGYTYSISNRATAQPAKKFGPYGCDTFTWTPENGGLCAVNVKCQDVYGNYKTKTQYVFVNQPLKIDTLTSDHECNECELQGRAKLGETINIKATTSGGYFDGKRYTYTISPRSASPENRDVTYYNQKTGDLAWTPKYTGIYGVTLDVKDKTGNTASKNLYFMIEK